MATEKNASLTIGAFIVGAILLVFAALIFFSGGRMFSKKEQVIMYFTGSVQGLQVGAPVKLKGVVLGEVTDIQLVFQSEDKTITNPDTIVTAVTAEVVMKRINLKRANTKGEFFNQAIDNGLRAQLNFQSFLTGLLYVELDFHPDQPAKLYALQNEIREIPTVATGLQELAKSLQEMNLKGLASNLEHMTSEVNKIVDSGAIQQTIGNIDGAAVSIKQTANSVNELAVDFKRTRQEVDTLLKQWNEKTPQLAQSLETSMNNFDHSLEKFNQATTSITGTFAEDTPIMVQLTSTLEDLSRTAQALRNLSETLEQQPEALVRGRTTDDSRSDQRRENPRNQ